MKFFTFIVSLLCSLTLVAQQSFNVAIGEKYPLDIDTYIATDDFGATYFKKNEILYKTTDSDTISYQNNPLGHIVSVDILNPLKITAFHKFFNTAVILDNTLSELEQINFNTLEEPKNIAFATTAHERHLWVLNADTQELELFDYNAQKSILKTTPIADEIIDQVSDYNYCWLISKYHIYKYNRNGSLVEKLPHDEHSAFSIFGDYLLLAKKDKLFYNTDNSTQMLEIVSPDTDIQNLYHNGNKLYIYDGEFVHTFEIQ